MFTIVAAGNHEAIFLWGAEVVTDERTVAVVYRPDSHTGEPRFGVHESAEAARSRYDPIIAMELVWEPDEISEPSRPGGPGAAAEPGHLRAGSRA